MTDEAWINYHVVIAVPDHWRDEDGFAEFLIDGAEDNAREQQNVLEVDQTRATVAWHEVTTLNKLALEEQAGQPLEVGDFVAHITLPCRLGS